MFSDFMIGQHMLTDAFFLCRVSWSFRFVLCSHHSYYWMVSTDDLLSDVVYGSDVPLSNFFVGS
jgi:hypothetical protein